MGLQISNNFSKQFLSTAFGICFAELFVTYLKLNKQRSENRKGLPWWFSSKESACNAQDVGSIPGSGRSPGEGNGNPLQFSCLENPTDRVAWRATVHEVAKESDTTDRLNNNKR